MTDDRSTSAKHHFPQTVETRIIGDPRSLAPFDEIFNNRNPVEVEIGCGKGSFLVERALGLSHINFLGIDSEWKWMRFGVRRSRKKRMENIKFLKSDAVEAIEHGIAPESVSVFHIYFPDPWPRRRHRKRRLITGNFLGLLHQRLVETGFVELATDHAEYFRRMQDAVIQSGISWNRVRRASGNQPLTDRAKTNYEAKYERAGRVLHYLELQK